MKITGGLIVVYHAKLRLKKLTKSSSAQNVREVSAILRRGMLNIFSLVVFLCLVRDLLFRLYLRFRIVVLADDSTLVTNVLLLDRFVKRVAGTTVANILNEIKKVMK